MGLILVEVVKPEGPLDEALHPAFLETAVAGFYDGQCRYYERVIMESGRDLWFRLDAEC
jgi:hypothetical protein